MSDQNVVLEKIFKNACCDQIWNLKGKNEYHVLGMNRVLEYTIKHIGLRVILRLLEKKTLKPFCWG